MQQRTFLGHPIGLYVLFFTEMWERFCYYGMRALLILYLTGYWKMTQQDASTIYKIYTTLVYVTPILGGYLADRFLGNRLAVVIGALLMAIGEFALTVPNINVFYVGLGFLIFGNGFFKPNMSIQVGRLYPPGDPRRDGAYTIFYMGINLGAFLAPLLCGWFSDNFAGGRRTGFAVAGFGMLFALAIYLLGQKYILELPQDTPAESSGSTAVGLTEAQAEKAPSSFGALYGALPTIIGVAGVAVTAWTGWLLFKEAYANGMANPGELSNGVVGILGGVALLVMAGVAAATRNGVRDRVMAILAMGIFTICFWGVFEQAGNVLNVWAEHNTNRFLTKEFEPPAVLPTIEEDKPGAEGQQSGGFGELFRWKAAPAEAAAATDWTKILNPVNAESFQSINALLIFVFAPVFAWMWVWMSKRSLEPSTPMKMAIGLVLVSASVFAMVAAAKSEDRRTEEAFAGALPAGLAAEKDVLNLVEKKKTGDQEETRNVPVHAGRLKLQDGKLVCQGALPANERDRIVGAAAPAAFVAALEQFKKDSKDLAAGAELPLVLKEVPPGFDMRFSGLKKSEVEYDASKRVLVAHKPIGSREIASLKVAAAEPKFREAMGALFTTASKTCVVSPWWLVLSYLLATFGELCLSPVGLSMVSKLAPAKFATMLMGMWLLMSAIGNFVAGALGEMWGTIPPTDFFWLTTFIGGGAALALFLIAWLISKAMHGVR